MNTKTLFAAATLALLASTSYAADLAWGSGPAEEQPSTLTRAQVRAELQRAASAGEVAGYREAYGVPGPALAAPTGMARADHGYAAPITHAANFEAPAINGFTYGDQVPVDGSAAPAFVATGKTAHNN